MTPEEQLIRYALARRPEPVALPRAEVYRGLVRNNLRAVIENAFPVTIEVLGDEAFDGLYADFLEERSPATHLYRDIPGDVVRWALESDVPEADLMHYEWLELLAARHPADVDALDPSLDGRIRLNPTLQLGVYQRHVHELSAERRSVPPLQGPVAYLLWRRAVTDEVVFHRLGLLLARVLAYAQLEPAYPELLVDRLISDQPGLDRDAVLVALRPTLTVLRERGCVL